MILLGLASVEELNLDSVPALYTSVVFVQADKTFISWAFCNHCNPTHRTTSVKEQGGQKSQHDEGERLT